MQQDDDDTRGDHLGQTDEEVRAAVRFVGKATVAGLAFLLAALLWVHGCGVRGPDALDTVACGAPYRTALAVGSPLIFAGSGLFALWRTYRLWRVRGTWWGWQGAGWFLFALMVFIMITTAEPIVGPALRR